MITLVRSGCFRRFLPYRRRKRAVFAILGLTGLFLILYFENSAIERQQATSLDVEKRSKQELRDGLLAIGILTSNEHYRDNSNRNSDHDRTNFGAEKQLRLEGPSIGITGYEHAKDKSTRSSDFGDKHLRLSYNNRKVNNTVADTVQGTAKKQIKYDCPEIVEKPRFREIVKEALVYSVWFDDRKSQHFIRILLLSLKKTVPSLTCLFKSASKQETFAVEASFYEHNESYQRRFAYFIASCVLPKSLDNIPCFVNISATLAERSESNAMVFPVRSIGDEKGRIQKKYGICIPPVHGEISVGKIIEFLELTQILGASHFTFYDLSMSESVRNVLNHYQDLGLVSVFPWNLPSYIGKNDLHYFGQPLAIWECLFRSMRHFDFVAFHDWDEFIVPLRHENITAMLEYIHKENHCGHCFESVLLDPSTDQNGSHLITQRVFHRTSQVTPFYTKCIVDPRRIFEQGIHHISKPIEEFYEADKVNWEVARVFHYRKCHDSRAAHQPRCSSFIVDKTMQRFGEKLKYNFELKMNIIPFYL